MANFAVVAKKREINALKKEAIAIYKQDITQNAGEILEGLMKARPELVFEIKDKRAILGAMGNAKQEVSMLQRGPPGETKTVPASIVVTNPNPASIVMNNPNPSVATSTAPQATALSANFLVPIKTELMHSVHEEFDPRFEAIDSQFAAVNTTLEKIDSTLEKALTGQNNHDRGQANAEVVIENASSSVGEQKITLPHIFWLYYDWAYDHGTRVSVTEFITEVTQDYFKKVKNVQVGVFTGARGLN